VAKRHRRYHLIWTPSRIYHIYFVSKLHNHYFDKLAKSNFLETMILLKNL
jgi:hypothetical protein